MYASVTIYINDDDDDDYDDNEEDNKDDDDHLCLDSAVIWLKCCRQGAKYHIIKQSCFKHIPFHEIPNERYVFVTFTSNLVFVALILKKK